MKGRAMACDAPREILYNLHDPVLVVDHGGQVLCANRAAGTALRRDPRELVGSAFGFPLNREKRTEVSLVQADGGLAVYDLIASDIVLDGEPLSVVTLHDVSDRRADLERTNRLVDELRRTNSELERFFHVASHDLQEPLRLTMLHAQVLEREAADLVAGRERAANALKEIHAGAERALALVRDLLAYGRVAVEERPREPVPLATALDDARRVLAHPLREAGATIEVVDPLPTVSGDPVQFTDLFQNLLSNAVKFRRPDAAPRIRIDCTSEDGLWQFSVADNGIGVGPRHTEQVFEVFRKLQPPGDYPGTGIGLALCRRIVEAHGGRIWAVPREDGPGTVIRFTLPVTREARPDSPE